MAITFLDPGGDATFNLATITAGGFWTSSAGSLVTDFVHGGHVKSYSLGGAFTHSDKAAILSDSGSRVSTYLYINTLPAGTNTLYDAANSGSSLIIWRLMITNTGVLQLWNGTTAQIGTNGARLLTGVWYRISIAYTIASTSVNQFEVFINGVSSISVTNATLTNTATDTLRLGNSDSGAYSLRVSDIYVDNSSSLTDVGNIWVTAKRPNANGTTNGFTTQIGAGGSGYGTGHSPQINERPYSNANGWSMVGAGSAVTEEYNIESIPVGDINISDSTIVDYMGWANMSSLAGETVQIIVNASNFAQAITSTKTTYMKAAGSSTYPSGTGADIGITTDTSLTTVSLYECGIMVAYIPRPPSAFMKPNYLRPHIFSPGLAR